MKRTALNPWDWSLNFGFNQGEIIEGSSRQLVCAGQTAVDGEGSPQAHGDMRGQITLALDNLEAVLQAGKMGLAHVTKLTIYTTDMDETLQNWDAIASRLGAADNMPPLSLLGVNRLVMPELMIEIEATAAD